MKDNTLNKKNRDWHTILLKDNCYYDFLIDLALDTRDYEWIEQIQKEKCESQRARNAIENELQKHHSYKKKDVIYIFESTDTFKSHFRKPEDIKVKDGDVLLPNRLNTLPGVLAPSNVVIIIDDTTEFGYYKVHENDTVRLLKY